MEINAMIEQFKKVVDNPGQAVSDYKNETGKGAVGCLPPYVPEEIIHAAGYLPVGLWGGQTELKKVRVFLPAFACSIMQSVMEMSSKGTYDELAAVIVPSPCDTLKCIGQKWKGSSPCIQFTHPQNRKLDCANEFLSEEYEMIRTRLEGILEKKIADEDIAESIKIYNEYRKTMREFVKTAGKYPNLINAVDRHTVIKASFFIEKSKYTEMVKELIKALNTNPEKPWDGKKVVVTGITLEPYEMLEIFDEQKVSIVEDDLAHSSRQFREDVPEDYGTPIQNLSRMWQNLEGCSLAFDPAKKRIQMVEDMVKNNNADGAVVAMMKFCDPEEYDYPVFIKDFEKAGIPLLYIDIDQQTTAFEQARTRIQSFTEML